MFSYHHGVSREQSVLICDLMKLPFSTFTQPKTKNHLDDFPPKGRNVRKIWAVILGMLTSGRKARNDSLPCWTVNHMWEAKKRVLMWWRLTCGNKAVEFKTCHNIARVSRLLGRFNKKIKMHSGLKKKMWGSGRAGNSCEYNVGLIRVRFWNLIDGFKSGLPHQHLSLSPAFSCFLSFLHLKLADGYYYRRKKTKFVKKWSCFAEQEYHCYFQGGVAECFFFACHFLFHVENKWNGKRFSIKEYFNLLGGNYEYKAACECLAACSSWHSSVLITFRGCFICRYILLCKLPPSPALN